MKKIYSILVAYNPDLEELIQAVERLKKQTDIVIVCNNSDYDVEFEDEQVEVFNFGENLGIAKAQSIGMKMEQTLYFKWIKTVFPMMI